MTSIFKLKGKVRRLVAYGLTMALILSFGFTNLIAYADDIADGEGAGFSDIEGHWAKDQILSWSEKGLVAGYEDGTFGPERGVTRAEFITFINRAYGLTEKSGTSFSDVAAEDWFSDEVAKAVAAEYISGYDDETMRPAAGISRLEAAVILYRLLRLTSPKSSVWVDRFMDSSSIAEWGKDQVNSAVAEGYLSGYPDGTFKPDNIITRAETVALLSKAVGVLYNTPGIYGPEGNGVIEGNVTVNVSGVTLKDLTIEGDLFLTAGIGDGDFNADGVTVKGRTIVGGGGRESIVFNNSSLGDVIVYVVDGKVRVVAMGDTSIDDVILESGGFLQEENLTGEGFGGVQILVLKPGQEVELDGDFDWVSIETSVEMSVSGDTRIKELNVSEEADGTQIDIGKDAVIDTLTLDGATGVTGKGTIKTANVNTDDYSFEKEPEATVAEGEKPEEDKKEDKGGRREQPSKKAVSAITITTTVCGNLYNGSYPLPNFEGVTVILETDTPGADIYYTLDGKTPTIDSEEYDEKIIIETENPFGETITLKAVAVKDGYTNSEVLTQEFVFSAKDPVESFNVEDEFVGWFKDGYTRPKFEAVQGEDFWISSITGSIEEGYEIKLTGTIKVFRDEDPRQFGHGGTVALLALKYNIPEEFANDDGLTEVGITWTAPIQSKIDFNESPNSWRKVDEGNYDSLILTSNVFALKDESKLKFAANWNGVQNEEDGYVEYTLDISEVEFELALSEEVKVLNYTTGNVYDTIHEAIDEAANNDTIVLNTDLTIDSNDYMYSDYYAVMISGKSLTIDLNGHTLSSEANATVYISSTGELTLIDSATGGEIESTGWDAVGNYGTFTMKSGELYSEYGYALYNFNYQGTMYGKAVIEDGILTGNDRGIANCGILEISEGNISITDDGYDIDNSGKLIVSGELVVDTMLLQDGTDAPGVDDNGTMIIADNAILKGLGDSWIWVEEGANIEIEGTNNFFSLIGNQVEPQNIPGKEFEWDGDKWVEFIGGSVVNATKGIGYDTLEEAVAAAEDNDTLILGQDVTLSKWLVLNRPIILNGNGRTITTITDPNGPGLQLQANSITIKNVTIDGSAKDLINLAKDCEDIAIKDVIFRGNAETTRYGFYANSGFESLQITNSEFKDLKKGIGLENGSSTILDNDFENILGNYLEVQGITEEIFGRILDDNTFDVEVMLDGINIKKKE